MKCDCPHGDAAWLCIYCLQLSIVNKGQEISDLEKKLKKANDALMEMRRACNLAYAAKPIESLSVVNAIDEILFAHGIP